jgi:spore maturation protein CgeB
MSALRIAVVGPIYGGSLTVAQYATRTLADMGHAPIFVGNESFGDAWREIERLDLSAEAKSELEGELVNTAAQVTAHRIAAARPDLVLYLAQAPTRRIDLDRLRELGIPSVFWFVEDFRTLTYWQQTIGWYDHFWTIQDGEFVRALGAAGQRSVDFVPLGCDPQIHRRYAAAEVAKWACDLSFAGSGYPNRRKVLASLVDLAPRLYGTHWKGDATLAPLVHNEGTLSASELAQIFAASRINLNICSSLFHDDLCARKDFLNPRTFEICGSGGFQLIDAASPIEGYFEPGKEIVTFASLDEAREKSVWYLEHERERQALADAGYARAHEEHRYHHRLAPALARLVERDGARLLERGDRARRELEACRDPGLAEIIAAVAKRERVSLSSLAREIRDRSSLVGREELKVLFADDILRRR